MIVKAAAPDLSRHFIFKEVEIGHEPDTDTTLNVKVPPVHSEFADAVIPAVGTALTVTACDVTDTTLGHPDPG